MREEKAKEEELVQTGNRIWDLMRVIKSDEGQ